MRHTIGIDTIQRKMADGLLEEVRSLPRESFDRYSNPFEQKWTYRDKHELPPECERMMAAMESVWLASARALFRIPDLRADLTRHWAGLFIYDEGDWLRVHVDAGVHPHTAQFKAVTVLLYLGNGEGDLEFWNGTDCSLNSPHVEELAVRVTPKHGMVVMFENTDFAWHGIEVNRGPVPRTVMTVSYVSDSVLPDHSNVRQRAYFVPRPNERWNDAITALRDQRADSKAFAGAYRT